MVAVVAVIAEVLSCNNASMRYSFKGEKPANPPAQARTKNAPAALRILDTFGKATFATLSVRLRRAE
jgi:hypothetical protein